MPNVRARRIISRIVLIALIACLAVGAFFAVRHYLHRDDAHLIQGEWRVEGEHMTMVIDENDIKMPGGVEFSYAIDPDNGKLTLANGTLTGSAAYRLTDNGATLVLTERLPYSKTDDQGQTVVEYSTHELLLTRISYDTTAQPQLQDG